MITDPRGLTGGGNLEGYVSILILAHVSSFLIIRCYLPHSTQHNPSPPLVLFVQLLASMAV